MTNWDHMIELVSAIPDLDGARCNGAADLYEATIAERGKPASTADIQHARVIALRTCAGCDALDRCRAWFDGLKLTQRPRGVVAGRIVTASGHLAKTIGKHL